MVVRRYKSANAMHPRKGYQEPFAIITPILDHRDGHYVRPNKVTIKYLDFKKNVDPNAHVIVFNSIVKANAKTFEEYIINAFSYTLKDTTLNWCHNYMSEFLDCTFSKLTWAFYKCHQKTQNDEQIYMELKNIKQEETKKVEVYYEWIQNLAHGLQILTTNSFLTTLFKVGLQSYFIIATTRMKQSTLKQNKEAAMLCEKGITTAKVRSALLVPQNTK